MATPIGHAVAGYAVYSFAKAASASRRKGLLIVCAIAAMAPDLDVLPGLVMGTPARYHQGITHSLGFALPVSLGIAALLRTRGWSFSQVFALVFISYTSHLVIDLFGPDGRPPYGIPLFWPVSGAHFISPLQVLPGVHHAASTDTPTSDWVRAVFSLYNLGAIAIEVLLVLPFAYLGRLLRRRKLTLQVDS